MQKSLSALLGLDALIAIAFGVASFLRPIEIYGSIIDLDPVALHEGTVAALTSLSLFYALVGAVAVVAIWAKDRTRLALVALMLARHLLTGLKAYSEAGASWQVGDPTPDLVIHAVFVFAYASMIALAVRARADVAP